MHISSNYGGVDDKSMSGREVLNVAAVSGATSWYCDSVKGQTIIEAEGSNVRLKLGFKP